MNGPATVAQLTALVAATADDRRRVFAVEAPAEWSGPATIDTDVGPARVVPCASPLAVHEALVDHAADAALVLLTPCPVRELGLDVQARLVKGRVLPRDVWQGFLALFKAREIDPQLVAQRWLVEALIDLAPADGYAAQRPISGVVDIDRAWTVFHERRFGAEREPTSVDDILEVLAQPVVADAIEALPSEARASIAVRWTRAGGAPVDALIHVAIEHPGDLVPLGLVQRALWADGPDDATTAAPRIRLEPILGDKVLSAEQALAWAAAAERIAMRATAVDRAGWFDRAGALLRSPLRAEELAERSDVLPRAFDARLDAVADALEAALDDASPAAITALAATIERLARHTRAQSPGDGRRVERAQAALALLRRSTPANVSGSFDMVVRAYRDDLAWVDDARQQLHLGESHPELAEAYQRLLARIDDARCDDNARFAEMLVDWSANAPAPGSRPLPAERVLDEIMSLAAHTPVLVLVLDGLSLAVAHRLAQDFDNAGWQLLTPEAGDSPVVVAALPTVTSVARPTLLSGRLCSGGQDVERAGFAGHVGLRSASRADAPPVLFHKADLATPNGNRLRDDVYGTIASDRHRVVGAVVNSIDDHLARGDQLHVDWSIDAIRPLGWLLDAASAGGRVVVVVSDHGHVLDRNTRFVHPGDTPGERWRLPVGVPQDGEIAVRGPRVLEGGGEVIAAWDERLCYGARKHGYHGGVSPQEVLTPFAVFSHGGVAPEGWLPGAITPPAWWRVEPADVVPAVVPAAPARRGNKKSKPAPEAPELFAAPTDWITALVAAPRFVANRKRLARMPLDDATIRTVLTALHARGGTLTVAALANAIDMPEVRLRGPITTLRRLLNVDGYEVLGERNGTLTLSRPLLVQQFGVELP